MIKKTVRLIKKQTRRVLGKLSSLFIEGFCTILPVCLTITIVSFSFSLLKAILSPLSNFNIPYLNAVPHSEIILMIAIIFLAGLFLKSFVMRWTLQIFENLFSRIPLIRPIYVGIKQLVDAFSPSDNPTFKKIVLVEFPRKGMYSIGFLTSEFSSQLTPSDKHETYYSIFVPMTPNPTNGFFIAITANDFTEIDLTIQEAMALVMSGGIIQPDRLKKQ